MNYINRIIVLLFNYGVNIISINCFDIVIC